MKLQVAMDVASLDEALTLSRQVAEYVDIIELGTPLIKHEGVSAIGALKSAHPDKIIFADMKTADAGELEADMAFAAGADLMTVMGAADDDTIAGAVAAARRHGKGVVADMITVADRVTRAKQVADMGVEFCEIHAGLDEQAQEGYSIHTVIDAGRRTKVPFSVAGGVDVDTIRAVLASGAVVAVAGGAIRNAADPAAAARALREVIGQSGSFETRPPRPGEVGGHGLPAGPGPNR